MQSQIDLCPHTNSKPYTCEECNQRFSQQCTLNTDPVGDTNLSCEECNIEFSEKSDFNRHFLFKHGISRSKTKEKLCICEICFKGFSNKRILKAHYLLHTGEKPYACEKCSRNLCSKWSLINHQQFCKHARD